MSKFEKIGQTDNQKPPESLEGGTESHEQFGDRALRAAQEVYSNEVQALDKKISFWKDAKNLGYTLALPGSLYVIGKFFGVDEAMGLSTTEITDRAAQLGWAIPILGASSAIFVQAHFEEKLKELKEKFGILSGPEDKEIE